MTIKNGYRAENKKLIYFGNETKHMLDFLSGRRECSAQQLITEALEEYLYKNIIRVLDIEKILKGK